MARARAVTARTRIAGVATAALIASAILARPAPAQGDLGGRTLPELRVDVIDPRAPRRGAVEAGLGLNVPLGYYARFEAVAAGGRLFHDSLSVATGRVDLLGRFLLDPFRENRWGLSVGGGLGLRAAEHAKIREYLVVVVDVELPHTGPRGLVTAVQAGLGGGARVGLVLRPYTRATR